MGVLPLCTKEVLFAVSSDLYRVSFEEDDRGGVLAPLSNLYLVMGENETLSRLTSTTNNIESVHNNVGQWNFESL
jgi:hypothetical protein